MYVTALLCHSTKIINGGLEIAFKCVLSLPVGGLTELLVELFDELDTFCLEHFIGPCDQCIVGGGLD